MNGASANQRVHDLVKSFYADLNSHGWAHALNYTIEDWVTSTRSQIAGQNYDTYAIST